MYPSIDEISALHHKYAPSDEVFDLVFLHCLIVRDIALQLIETNKLDLNVNLVRTGALLHDIGVHVLFGKDGKLREGVNYITHGTEGEKILQKENFSEEIWRFAAHHTGVGLTKKDVADQNLPLPSKNYLAETNEELIVMYADKFHSKTTPPFFNSFEWYRNDVAKFGKDKVKKFDDMADKFGKPDLSLLRTMYGYEIR